MPQECNIKPPTTVANTTERNAILPELRYEGMMVWVSALETVHRLVGGIENTDWQVFTASDPRIITGNPQYYISPSGSDDNDGISAASPWQTNAKVANWLLTHLFNGRVILNYAQGTYTDALNIQYFGGRELRIVNASSQPENYGYVVFAEPITLVGIPVVSLAYVTVSKADTGTAASTALTISCCSQATITGFNSIGLGAVGINFISVTGATIDAVSSRMRNKTYGIRSYRGHTQITGVSSGSSGNTYVMYARQGNHTTTNAAGGAPFGTPASGGRNASTAEGGLVTDFSRNNITT